MTGPAPTNPNLINEPDLMAWLGYKRRLDLIEALRQSKIPYLIGKGGAIATTVDAVNRGLIGADPAKLDSDAIQF